MCKKNLKKAEYIEAAREHGNLAFYLRGQRGTWLWHTLWGLLEGSSTGVPRWRWVACTHPEHQQVLARAVQFQECISNYSVLLLPLTKTCEIIVHPCQDTKIVIWPLPSMVRSRASTPTREVWSAILSQLQLGSHHRTLPISVVSAPAYASCKARCQAGNLDYSQRVQALSPETNIKGLGCPWVFLFSSS